MARKIAAGLLLAFALAGRPAAAEPTAYRPAGVAKPECRSGLSFGLAAIVRFAVGCQMARAREVDLAAPDLATEFRRVTTGRVGRNEVHSVTDELLAAWVKDPASSLVPRPNFRPRQVEALEFAETSGYGSYVSPTGGAGLATREATALAFRGRLVADTEQGPKPFALSGRLIFDRVGWKLAALKIDPL